MENNKLDKLFQDKLTAREFEFQDSYWQEAEALIAAEENGRRNRRWGFLLLLGIILLGGAVALFFQSGSTTILEQASNNILLNDSQNTATVANVEDSVNETMEVGKDANSPLEKTSKQTPKNETTYKADFNKEILKKEVENVAKKKEKTGILNTKATKKDNPLGQNLKSKIKNQSTPIASNNGDFQDSATKAMIKDGNDQQNLGTEKVANTESTKGLKKEISTNEAINELTTAFPLLNWERYLNRKLQNIEINLPPNAPKSHRWNIGLTAGIGLIANKKSNDESLNHYFGGVTAGYRLTSKMSLQTGLWYKLIQADFERSTGSQQVSYGFGKQDDIHYLKADQLHFVELPIWVSYGSKKSQFSIGFKTGKLLGAKGGIIEANSKNALERTEEENNAFNLQLLEARANGDEKPVFREETQGKKGWLSTDNFRTWQFSLLGQYQFAVSNKFSLGLGIEYRLNSDYLKDGGGVYSPMSVQFFTTYRIFN